MSVVFFHVVPWGRPAVEGTGRAHRPYGGERFRDRTGFGELPFRSEWECGASAEEAVDNPPPGSSTA